MYRREDESTQEEFWVQRREKRIKIAEVGVPSMWESSPDESDEEIKNQLKNEKKKSKSSKKKKKKDKKKKKRKNNAKFSGHYVRPCTHNMRAHALHSHQNSKS